MSSNERKSLRIESDKFISYSLFDSDNRICDQGMALARDISRSGVAVENRIPFEVGTKITLSIALSDDVIEIKGLVRNCKKITENAFLIGIEFIEISEQELTKLKQEFPNILS